MSDYVPDPKAHLYASIAKSIVRISGYALLFGIPSGWAVAAAIVLIASEWIGILEELVQVMSRTPAQQETIDKAIKLIDDLERLVKRYGNYLRMENQASLKEYIEIVRRDVIETELILEPQILLNMKWGEHNIRYGVDSIKGTLAEAWAAIAWNMLSTKDKCLLVPSMKEGQVFGQDLSFSAPQWTYFYHGQCKSAFFYKDGTFKFFEDWKQYDPTQVDRLLLVDIFNNYGLCVDYPVMLEYVNSLDWTRRTSLTLKQKDLLDNRVKFHLKVLKLT